jgi:hypothetical protein
MNAGGNRDRHHRRRQHRRTYDHRPAIAQSGTGGMTVAEAVME